MKKGFISAGITLEANAFSSRIECNVPSQISIKFLQISTSSEHRSQLSLLKMFFSSLPYLPNFPLILSDSISTALCLSIKKKKKNPILHFEQNKDSHYQSAIRLHCDYCGMYFSSSFD